MIVQGQETCRKKCDQIDLESNAICSFMLLTPHALEIVENEYSLPKRCRGIKEKSSECFIHALDKNFNIMQSSLPPRFYHLRKVTTMEENKYHARVVFTVK